MIDTQNTFLALQFDLGKIRSPQEIDSLLKRVDDAVKSIESGEVEKTKMVDIFHGSFVRNRELLRKLKESKTHYSVLFQNQIQQKAV